MPQNQIQFATTLSFLGGAVGSDRTVTGDNGLPSQPTGGVPAAKAGVLTTRTSASVGTLTMDPGHGFATGNVVSIFWAGGSRYGVTLGTVSGDSCPFSGGAGDDLPAADTAVTAMVPAVETVSVTGDNVTCAAAYAALVPTDGDAVVQVTQANDTVIATYILDPGNPTGFWDGTGTNPFAGVTVGKIKYSHGRAAALVMGFYAPYN